MESPVVNAHRVYVLYRADDDDGVVGIAHHLQLVFFPAQDRLFNQDRMNRRIVKAAAHDVPKLGLVVSYPAARAAERERGPDDGWVADLLDELEPRRHTPHHLARWGLDANLRHRRLEKLPVLALLDRVIVRADEFDAVPFQHARLEKRLGKIQRRLPAQRRQERVGLLGLDNSFGKLERQRLDIRFVRHLRVGHDGRGVRVDEDHLKARPPQRLAGLRARIVELGGLAYHDGAGAENQDFMDVRAFGHGRLPPRGEHSTGWGAGRGLEQGLITVYGSSGYHIAARLA